MAVYHDSRCRLCRREGMKLFLKGSRCFSDKCAFERRGYAPGEHGKSRRVKVTDYGQLNHAIAVNRLLGYENRVAMTNRRGHSPTEESNEQLYLFFEHFLKHGKADRP